MDTEEVLPDERERTGVCCHGIYRGRGKKDFVLYTLSETPIERHIKINGEYNPFDPSMEAMGEKLRMERMLKS